MDNDQFWQAVKQFKNRPPQQWQQKPSLSGKRRTLEEAVQQYIQIPDCHHKTTQAAEEFDRKAMKNHVKGWRCTFLYISQRLNEEVNTEVNLKEEGQAIVTQSEKILDEKKIGGDAEKIERKEKEELSEKNKDEEKEKEVVEREERKKIVCANTSNNKAPLGHPSLITHLCKLAGVDTSVPPFERPRKAIDEAYYRQYCGGEDAAQPVPPCRARRERGPVQSQTSAETHEAEPFQMRDMYMSLIGAQLQSIHRGQVATAEMIVGMYDTPPAHRWTMDEFHNVVAWPEEPTQGGGAEAAEASVREMEEDDDDAFEDDEDEEEEEDTEDSSD
ncbi:hypothetical protein LR48_Vigan08g075100 [Vigna angularis]|uniref:Uncharacterized protein n=1 Tax=Phaseolus angularis TaxID=3914 RepID=A0A0L9V5E0_PHAAN|nr:hypothetical protein LR48_Vigan08g075100 [Vigna angularis]